MSRFGWGRCLIGALLSAALIFGVSGEVWADELEQKTRDFVQQLARKMTEQHRTTVAVLDFARVEDDSVNAFGRLLAEELVTKLTDLGGFQIVERRFLNKILREQKWTLTDLVNPQTAVRFGQLSGVQALITGTLADEGSYLRVNGRLIGTETGYVIASAAITLFKDERISRVWAQGASPIPEGGAPPGTGSGELASRTGTIKGFQGLPPVGKVITRSNHFEIDLAAVEVRSEEIEVRLGVTNVDQSDRTGGVYPQQTYLVDDQGQQYKATKVVVIGERQEGVDVPPGVRRVVQVLFPVPGPRASSVTWVILPYNANRIIIRNTTVVR